MADDRKRALTIGQLTGALAELNSQSDRGAAVIAGCLLDDVLREILREVMVFESAKFLDDKLFFGPTKPLASLSAKTNMAYCLGLFSKNDYRAFEHVRAIRNRFAHTLDHVTFTDSTIRPLCTKLDGYWQALETKFSDELLPDKQSDERRVFIQVVSHLSLLLLNESLLIATKLSRSRDAAWAAASRNFRSDG